MAKCLKPKCKELPTKHIIYGTQQAESYAPYVYRAVTWHSDVCDKHAEELKEKYSDAREVELGKCGDDCPILNF